MLPSFCRVTGNSRNLPKPNYFPLLPPISPVEARRLCRLMGKAVPSEDHQYVPLIEFARQSKAVKCHITSHADDQHHYQQQAGHNNNNNNSSAAAAGIKCRITAKHQINDNDKYLYPVLKENSHHDLKQLKKILERMNSRLDSLTVQPGQRFVYQLDDNHLNLVLPAEMEAAIRRGEIENLLISKDGSTVLIRLKDGPSLTLTLKAMAKQPTMDDGLLEGGGQDDEILQKQRQIRQYKKRKISDPKQYSIVQQLAPPSPVPSVEDLEELDPVVVADWNERMSKLTAGHRSAANLLALGTDWRDLLYPKIDTWDWEALPVIKEEDTPSLPVRNVVPVQLPVDQLLPGLVQSNQVPVLNEDTVGFEAVPVYDEPIRPFKGQLPASYIQALDRIAAGSQESTTKLKDLFSDVESLMFLPFVHEVGTVMTELDRGSVGWMVRTERDGVRFVKTRPAADDGQCQGVKAIGGMMVPVGQDEERFVVGQQVPSLGFVPGKWVGDSGFQPGCVVQNPEGAGFIPGCIFNGVFAAGQITQRDGGPPQFVSGQAVQTLFGPKFLPGRTIQTDEGLKFVAGQTWAGDDKFHPGQIFQTANGPAFISGVTFDTPQGARFIAGQVDVEGQFVPGQVLMDGPNGQAEFTAGENLETADGPLFLPGQSYKTPDGRTKFCPGRQMVLEDGQKRFVPGETMISKEGRQFVAGVLAEERFIPCQIDLKETSSSSNAGRCGVRLRPATKEEDIFFCAGLSDGLPIDNSTFSAMPRKKPDMGYMIQHEDKVKFLPTEQNQEELLVGNSNDTIKVVPGQLLEMDDTPKFIPGKTIESALGNIFIPGQAVRTGPNKIEQFVPGQVIDTGNSSSIEGISGPMFCPGQMVNCESGKKFVPGQVFGSKTGPRFVPGKILMSPSGVSTFIPGQVVYSSDRGSVFVPGNIVDTSSGPFFVPGRVVDLPSGGIKFVAGEIIETDSGPRYVTEHETDLDLLDETEDQKEIVVQGFPVTPEELRLITAYPFAALHYPLKDGDGPIINSRMLRQMAAAGVAVNKLTNTIPPPANNNNNNNKDKDGKAKEGNNQSTASLNDVKVVAPKDIDESILGANVFRTTEPPPKPPPPPANNNNNNNNNKKKSTAADDNAKANKEGAKPPKAPDPQLKVTPPAPAPVVQPVAVAAAPEPPEPPEPSDGHVGPSVGSETSQIPLPPVPVATMKKEGDGEEPAPAPAETGGVSETAKTAEPANSSNAGNEQPPPKTSSPPPPSLGNDAKPTTSSAVSAAVVPPPSTKTSENQQSQPPPPPPTDDGAKKPLKPVDPPVVVRPVDPPVQPPTPPTPPTPPAKTTNDNNNNKNAGLLLAKDKADDDDDDASKNKRGADTNGPSIVESNCNSGDAGDAGDDANASRLNQQEITKDDSNSAGSVSSSSSQSIPVVTDDGNAGTGDKPPSPPPTARTCDSPSNLQSQHEPTTTGKNGDGDGRGGDRDESSVERQVLDIFERIKRDLDSVERDPFIKQTLTDAEALALANGRPDLADKVRQLLDILKNTERDPEVVELIKQILRMKKKLEAETRSEASRAAGAGAGSGISAAQSSSQSQQIQSNPDANKSSTSSAGNAGNQALIGGQSSNQSKNSAPTSAVAGAGMDQNSAGSQSKESKSLADKNGKGSSSDANGSPTDQKSAKGSSSSGLSGSLTDQKSNSLENSKKSDSANGLNSSDSKSTAKVSSKSDDQSNSTLSSSSSSNLKKKEEENLKNGDISRQGKTTTSALDSAGDGRLTSAVKGSQEKDILANSLLNDDQQRTGGSSTTGKAQQEQSSSSTAVGGGGGGDGSSCNGQGQTSSLSSSSSISGSQTGGAAGDACLTSQHLGNDGVDAATAANEAARKTKRRQRPSTTSNSDENNQLASSSSRDGDLASHSKSNDNGSAASRPTELAGLDMNPQVVRSQKSVDSPSTENRSPIDESKMIDKWQYYNSPISSEPPSRFPKDPNNNNNESKPPPPPPPPPPEPTRVRKISSETRTRNPRRVTSRSSSRLCGIDLSEEMSDDNGDLVEPIPADPVVGPNGVTLIPSVITSAKDISRDVIDTLRYSRDEAKKEFYTQKILEAVGLASPSGKRSPSNESEESGNGGTMTAKETGSRSRKSSSAASACIILKDFLQTIVPQEAAHNVLIGDIDYMVIDDEGVRYFESAMGFASRRNSRFDIRQAAATSARSRSGSQDHGSSAGTDVDLPSATSGPWPWADVGPRSRRASIDEFRKRLLEQDASVTSCKTRSPSRERPPSGMMIHGRHSVAAFPLSRATSSGYISPSMKPTDSRASRRGSLVEDYAMMSATAMAAANAAVLGRKRKVSAADASRQKRFSRTSFDGF